VTERAIVSKILPSTRDSSTESLSQVLGYVRELGLDVPHIVLFEVRFVDASDLTIGSWFSDSHGKAHEGRDE
jgi:hypothetical protein